MKLIKVILPTCFFYLLTIGSVVAQNGNVPNDQFKSYIRPLSPQSYDFVRYGNTPVSYFTGAIDLKIPLYTYKDRDFELPIFVGYNSSGFIPNKREGIVGLNFFLSAGGVITRMINNRPDDQMKNTAVAPVKLNGSWIASKFNSVSSLARHNLVRQGSINGSLQWYIPEDNEVAPDEFTFTMPGYNGKFFIRNDGKAKVVGNSPIKVDLTGLSEQASMSTLGVPKWLPVNNSEIVLTTDDGYKYYFGGTDEYLELSFPVFNDGVVDVSTINAWHLKKIIAPNGRTATFVYTNFKLIPEDYNGSAYKSISLDIHRADVGETNIGEFALGGTHIWSNTGTQASNLISEGTKTVRLEKIIIDDTEIKFAYSEKASLFFPKVPPPSDDGSSAHLSNNVSGTAFNQKGYQLDNIIVQKSQSLISRFDFKYKYLGGSSGTRQFLVSLKEKGKGPFLFEYYKTGMIPSPYTNGIDHWGYWNGGHSVSSPLIPSAVFSPAGDLQYTSTERDPNPTFSDVALLKKITYPTTGYTSYYYEAHDYSKRLERRSPEFLKDVYNVNGIAGGARVYKIEDYDGTKLEGTRTFLYRSGFPGNNGSSGILLSWPRYLYYFEYNNGQNQYLKHNVKQSYSYNVNYYPGESYIQYSEVTELIAKNGAMNYKFNNYVTNPDVDDIIKVVVNAQTQEYMSNVPLYNSFVGIKFSDRSFERGKPYEVTTYGQDNTTYYPLKKVMTEYTDKSNYPNDYVVSVGQTGGLAQSVNLYHYPYLPKRQTTITYSQKGQHSITSTSDMSYTPLNYLLTTVTSGSDGKTYKIKYKYVSDYLTGGLISYYQNLSNYEVLTPQVKGLVNLYENNILNKPVEIIGYVNDKVAGTSFIEYQDNTNAFRSTQTYSYKKWSVKTPQLLNDFVESGVQENSWSLLKDPRYEISPDVTILKRDNQGNILEQVDNSGILTSIVWAYNKTYAVAEIRGASYQTIIDVMGQAALDQLNTSPGDDSQVRQTLQSLRNSALLKSAQITTFTYAPLIGITSLTDPNGVIVYYEYDSLGRLLWTKDHNKNIMKKYEYNYQAK